ncbi:MAG: TylF/MycF/NovP-related O-methyltransferase [Thermodesulfobacteriota bacterium]|nr:TylF/MycF/NovP-related O-methyltransferase [Thermodesulfobacteriota bacterium]
MTFPKQINIGSGKDFRDDFLNIDVNDYWAPDIVCDLDEPLPEGEEIRFTTGRFGEIMLQKGSFKKILANDVLEHVADLTVLMKTCLDFLQEGGILEINVPYDLSLGAWQDPTHVRAFNENSWLYYTDWFWYLGWSEDRFILDRDLSFNLSELGRLLQRAGKDIQEIMRTPRAVDSMLVFLKKVRLTSEDVRQLEHCRGKKIPYSPLKQESKPREPVKPHGSDMSSGYCVWIVSPPDYDHSPTFCEVARGLRSGFAGLGIDAPIVTDVKDISGMAIVLGGNLIPRLFLLDIPEEIILFNLEQIQPDSPWMSQSYMNLLTSYPVWDYSPVNVEALKKIGVTDVTLCPIGYEKELTSISRAEEDIDVLFYGSVNDRRSKILRELKDRGVNVVDLFGIYGEERDAYIARAKIVLNVHYYESRVFEIVRVSYLLSNKKFVISESSMEPEAEKDFLDGIIFCPYEELVEQCLKYLQDKDSRRKIADRGFDLFSRKSQARFLQQALGADVTLIEEKVEVAKGTESEEASPRTLYLDLIQKCLTNTIYGYPPMDQWSGPDFDGEKRDKGLDWPSQAHTKIGSRRMSNLRDLTEYVILNDIPGDLIETGIWRGGACIYMRAILKAYNITDRTVWCADSFEGLPEPDSDQFPKDAGDTHHTYEQLTVSLEDVQANFKKYDLLDDQVKFLKGWFKETLPESPIEQLAILRLDGDMYQSTIEGFQFLYDKLSAGGFVIVDDYGAVPACRAAVNDFRSSRGITDSIREIDGIGVYWQKS